MNSALERLRLSQGGPAWRDTVIESAAVLTRGAAGLLSTLIAPETPALEESHLRAQRFARVRVAEMRLYAAAEVKSGQAAGNVYGALQRQIEAARAAFAGQFLTPPQGIPDYLHQEIVRVLAHNNEALLGPLYPGPLV